MNKGKTVEDHLGNRFESATAMCKFWNIARNIYYARIKSGWSVEDTLTTPIDENKRGKIVTDHLGNEFESITAMCEFWGITRNAYEKRIRSGWPVEKVLTTPVDKAKNGKKVADHLGNKFKNIKNMCKFWDIDSNTYQHRIKIGWSIEKALTTPPAKEKAVTDHLGNEFKSITAMCKFWGISTAIYRSRIKIGWSVEDALTTPVDKAKKAVTDHLGNEFKSVAAMCKFWSIDLGTYYNRRKCGWSIEKALATPANDDRKGKKVTDHLGNSFENITAMCEFWGITRNAYEKRIRSGWSVEKVLTTPIDETKNKNKGKTVVDHLGDEFKSIAAMCKFWGIDNRTYRTRINLGWSVKKALTTPVYTVKKGKKVTDHLGNEFESVKDMCKFWDIDSNTYRTRINLGWSVEEALTIPKNMYIGEYRVAEKLKKMHKKFYHNCSIKVIFEELDIAVDWKDFLNELQRNLGKAGYNWSVQKIQRLRPDFVIFTDEDNRIQGVIEFDGEQHQNFIEFFYRTIEQFYKQNNADMAKQSLFEYLSIPMLRIRHDQVNLIDEMVEDFVKNSENYITRHNTYLTEDEYWSILKEEKKKLDLVFA